MHDDPPDMLSSHPLGGHNDGSCISWTSCAPPPGGDDAVMTDMTEHRDVDTVIEAAIRDAVTDTAAVTMVTVEDAAAMAGVSVRTIRRWIQHGHLPHSEDENG